MSNPMQPPTQQQVDDAYVWLRVTALSDLKESVHAAVMMYETSRLAHGLRQYAGATAVMFEGGRL